MKNIRFKYILIFCLLFLIAVFFVYGNYAGFRYPTIKNKLDDVNKDWKKLRTGCFSYAVDFCGVYFPADTSLRLEKDPNYPLTFETDNELLKELYKKKNSTLSWCCLTTPIPYIAQLPKDPFNNKKDYGYTCWNIHDEKPVMGIFYSPGPNKKEELPLKNIRENIDHYFDLRGNNPGYLTKEDMGILKKLVTPYIYDPSNGTKSSGDLIWLIHHGGLIYGWGHYQDNEWKDAHIPELELFSGKEDIIPKEWDMFKPIPEPESESEKSAQNGIIKIPAEFEKFAKTSLGRNNQNNSALISEEDIKNLDKIRNHFGLYFGEFFNTPKILNEDELRNLNKWIDNENLWWEAMQNIPQDILKEAGYNSDVYIQSNIIFTYLPFFGKSQILLAAKSISMGDLDAAKVRVNFILSVLNYIDTENRIKYAYFVRIQSELKRLCSELMRFIV